MGPNFADTFRLLLHQFPDRLININLTSTVVIPDDLDSLLFKIENITSLKEINLSGNPLSNHACKSIQDMLINKDHLKDLDISNCKIQMQATRSIIWGINKNYGLVNFNF